MDFFIDLPTQQLVYAPQDLRQLPMVEIKRGDAATFRLFFLDETGTKTRLHEDTVITFALKEEGKYDAIAMVFEDGFTASTAPTPPDEDTNPHYIGTPSFNTAGLAALLFLDEDEDNDESYVDLMGEFSWNSATDGGPTSTRTVVFRVHNDVIRGDEATPDGVPTPDAEWLAHGHPQTLSPEQKAQARENMGLDTLQITAASVVANAAARLALSEDATRNRAIVEADTGDTYMLVDGGDPSVANDWLQIGDRDVQWSEVGGKPSSFTPSAHTHFAADVTDLGTAATKDSSTGGNGAYDEGKVPEYNSAGDLVAEKFVAGESYLAPDGLRLKGRTVAGFGVIDPWRITSEQTYDLPNASGIIALTSDIPDITGVLDLRGELDASYNTEYPEGTTGECYYVVTNGKVGGASGKSVSVGDLLICRVNNAGGTEAQVGTSWFVLEKNLVVGTTAGTVCAGDDARLSDARTPVAHTHAAADVTDLGTAATKDSTTGGNGAADDGNVPVYGASGELVCGTGGSITLSGPYNPGDDAGYVSTNYGGYISTGINAPITTGSASTPSDNDGGYINTGYGGFINTGIGGFINVGNNAPIDTTAGGSITTGTGHLTGPASDGTISLEGHTHAVTDLDIAGGSEINDALADGDLIPVRDVSGTPANKTTLLSRVWTYIKAKIDAGQTWGGAQNFSGQVELAAGQAATNPTSAMTLALGDARYGNFIYLSKAADTSLNTATRTIDPDLQCNNLAAGRYQVDALLLMSAQAAAPGYFIHFLKPDNNAHSFSSVKLARVNHANLATQTNRIRGTVIGDTHPVINCGVGDWSGTPPYQTVEAYGVLDVAEGSGIAIWWAQNSLDAVNSSIMKAGSFLKITKVS